MQGPLLGLCQSLIPVPDEDTPEITTDEAMPSTWADAYRRLYSYGTGWLGWTPAETWAATPQEIADAFTAHIAKLKTIHGSNEPEDATTGPDPEQRAQNLAEGLDPDFDRSAFNALKFKIMGG